jgi:hypothetical protein
VYVLLIVPIVSLVLESFRAGLALDDLLNRLYVTTDSLPFAHLFLFRLLVGFSCGIDTTIKTGIHR